MAAANVWLNVPVRTADRTVAAAHALRVATAIKAASKRSGCVTASLTATANNVVRTDVGIAAATARMAQVVQITVVVRPVRTNASWTIHPLVTVEAIQS